MIIQQPGKISERIWLLGRKESCVSLLKGDGEYALLGGGMVHIVPDVIEQLKQFRIEEEKIQRIIILHSHFDHCAIVPFFKKRWSWATVTASVQAKKLLALPKVIEGIEAMNQGILRQYGCQKKAEVLGLNFPGITVEEVVKEGDTLSCGDLSMEIIETPGHSSCSIAVYVPAEKAMFGSDAAGIPFGTDVFTAANSDFDKYEKSLSRIAGYEIDVYLPEHYGARTGEDARAFLQKSMQSATKTRKMLEASLQQTKDVKQSIREITDRWMEMAPPDFLPRSVLEIVAGQMLRYLSKQP